jgi:hypothetical protein
MPDNEMTEHLSASKMERFCARALEGAELTTVARHIVNCSDCGRQFVATLGHQKGTAPVSFTLAPEFWLRHEHIDYEQLVELADKKLDATDRELIDLHLKVCTPCREDVANFLTFREQIAPELQVSYAPVGREATRRSSWVAWWHGLAWKPIHAAAVVLIGIALVVGAAFFMKRRADSFQAKQTPTARIDHGAPGQTPTPDNRAANSLSRPGATPNELPAEKPNSAVAIVSLNDLAGPVTVDKSGNISGFDDVPPPTRDEIARVLLSERIEKPAILRELAGQDSTLRGSSGQSFKLISPSRTVLVSDRPRFIWEQVSRASTYRVYVTDAGGSEVARSEELPAERAEWTVSKPLKRGDIYAWTVVAVVDGKEIVSPGSSAPEMKFHVLSMNNLQQLGQLKRARSHLALGVFYAKVGMLAEAEHEFTQLSRLNPKTEVLAKLLHSVRALARP